MNKKHNFRWSEMLYTSKSFNFLFYLWNYIIQSKLQYAAQRYNNQNQNNDIQINTTLFNSIPQYLNKKLKCHTRYHSRNKIQVETIMKEA